MTNTTNTQIIPTANLIQETLKVMDEVNQNCFDNQLKLNFKVSLSKRAKAAGNICFSYNRFFGSYHVTGLQISMFYDWTLETLRNVVAHELIHVYEIQILKTKPAHRYNFEMMKMKINQGPHGYKVDTFHSMTNTKPKKAKTSTVPYILSGDGKRFNVLSLSLARELTLNPEKARNFYGNYSVGQIDSEKAKNYTVRRSLRSAYRMTPEKLQELGISVPALQIKENA